MHQWMLYCTMYNEMPVIHSENSTTLYFVHKIQKFHEYLCNMEKRKWLNFYTFLSLFLCMKYECLFSLFTSSSSSSATPTLQNISVVWNFQTLQGSRLRWRNPRSKLFAFLKYKTPFLSFMDRVPCCWCPFFRVSKSLLNFALYSY